ncbi:Uncharacterized protein CTYZ_00001058 [Cryptosporidium tyzzeri]|nr:Uncharacterized protein CTYZ_00001058 [Cryptosporidium tyzzeri]
MSSLRFLVFVSLFLGVFTQDQMFLGNPRFTGGLQERIFSSFPAVFNRADNRNSNSTEELKTKPTEHPEAPRVEGRDEPQDEPKKEEIQNSKGKFEITTKQEKGAVRRTIMLNPLIFSETTELTNIHF